MRISHDYHRIACDRFSQGIFNFARLQKNAQLAACYSSFSSKSMCKTITVDGEWKGVRGGKCGKPTSNSLSFSITIYQVCCDKASGGCYIPTHCPWLPANVTCIITTDQTDGQRDTRRDEFGGVCVGGGGTGRGTCRRARLPPVPARLTHHAAHPTWRRLTGACQEPEHGRTDGRATRYAAALADRRRSTAHTNSSTLQQHCSYLR